MALYDDLLILAKDLVNRNPAAPVEADLRRAVSTAYYALFHLLIHESTTRIIAIAAMRPRVVRAFEHRDMRRVCEEYSRPMDPAGNPILQEIQNISAAFTTLQQARHASDYDTAFTLVYANAKASVELAETSFVDWSIIHADPSADRFLTDLLFRSIRKR